MDDESDGLDANSFDDGSDAELNDAEFVNQSGGTGNPYQQNQTPTDVAENGGVNSSYNPLTGLTNTVASAPSWLQQLQNLATGNQAPTVPVQLVNGQPLVNPLGNAATTSPATATAIIGAILAALLFL